MSLIFSIGFTKLNSRAYLTPEVAPLRVDKEFIIMDLPQLWT